MTITDTRPTRSTVGRQRHIKDRAETAPIGASRSAHRTGLLPEPPRSMRT